MLFTPYKNRIGAVALGVTLIAVTTGCGAGSGGNTTIDGVIGPTFSTVNNTFILSMTLTQVTFDGGVRVPIPKMPNSYLEVGPDFQTSGTLISIGMDATDIANLTKGNLQLIPPQTLPGGRPLPGVSAGALPALAIEVPKWNNATFYVGPSVFGAFVPIKFPWQGIVGTFRFYDTKGKRVGNVSVVGTDTQGLNSGLLVLIDISGTTGNVIAAAARP